METIINYIENLFLNYPQTMEVIKAKEDLLSLMEDKYNELKIDGRTENEAIGIVISEFGNIDELAAELGVRPGGDKEVDERPPYRMGMDDVKRFLHRKQVFGQRIGFGVMLCILSPFMAGILELMADAGLAAPRLSEAVGSAVLFVFVAVAVGIFITSGLSNDKDEHLDKKKIVLDNHTRAYVQEIYDKYLPVFSARVVTGVILCIVSVIPGAFASELFDNTSLWWIAELSSMALFLFAASGVYCLISSGIRKSAMDLLLGKGDYSKESRQEREGSVVGIIASIYWPIATVIYLGWSFITNDWEITWIVWPIAGILFGGIAAVCSQIKFKKYA